MADDTEAHAEAAPTRYDTKYKSGGFGYEEQRGTWIDWTKQHYIDAFDLRPGMTLVDVGCGDGFWASLFHEHGLVVSGSDISAGGIEVARERYPECEFEVGSAEEPLFGGGRTWDVVFCRAISHFCVRDLLNPATLRVMQVMADAVADDGLALLTAYTRRNKENDHPCADHLVSDLVRLVETTLDPWRVCLVGNYVQIGARHKPS